jgi:O-antigen/teichoic acid export membrane protein
MTRGTSTLRSILIVLGSSWLTLLINVIRVLVVPNKLGDHGMGQVTLASSFTGFFIAFIVLGTSNYLVRAVAREPELLDRYISNALLLRIVVGAAVMGLMIGIAHLLGYAPQTQQVILIVALGMVIFSISNVFEAGLQATGQMSWRAIATAFGNITTTVLGVGLLFAGADAPTYALCIPIGFSVQLVGVLSYYVTRRRISFTVDPVVARALLLGGMPLFFWAFLQTAYGQIDAVLLSLFADERVVGWLGISMQITGVIMMIPIAINTVAMPVLCELYVKPGNAFREFATRTMSSILVVLVPVAAGLALSSVEVIQLLNYPAPFLNAAPVLSLLAILMPLTGALMVMANLAMAIGQERQWVKISAMGVCIFPPLYLAMIWVFQTRMGNGAIGTALASVIGESLLLAWAWFILPRELRMGEMLRKAVQVVALALTMSVVVILLKTLLSAPLFLYAPIGAAIYIAGVWMLKLVTPGDLQLVRNAVLKRRRRAEATT